MEKIGQGFYVVEANKFVVTMTAWKDSKKEESMVTKHGKAKRGQKEGGGGSIWAKSPSFSAEQGQGVVCWTCGGPHMNELAQISIYIQIHIFKY
jgi:hypothetical protein